MPPPIVDPYALPDVPLSDAERLRMTEQDIDAMMASINALTGAVNSLHVRLSAYETNVPSIARVKRNLVKQLPA